MFGSFERFIGLLIEHYAGAFPTWLSPVQISIVPVSEKFNAYAQEIKETLRQQGLRVSLNLKDESLGKRIREEEKENQPAENNLGLQDLPDGL